MSHTLHGRGAAPGVAIAPAFVLGPAVTGEPPDEVRAGSVQDEVDRLANALSRAEEQLRQLAGRVVEALGEEDAAIFEAHAEFAADPELATMARGEIEGGASAEKAVTTAFDTFRDLLAQSSSEYLAARAEDLDDVRDRVVAVLQGREVATDAPATRAVVVARELTPSRTAGLPRGLIAAIVTETGSPTSHAAILARALGIPAVVGCAGVLDAVEEGVGVAVDGRSGEVIVDPDREAVEAIERRAREEERRREQLTALRDRPGRTADGHPVEVAANIGSADDLPAAIEAGAQGSGLVRTEFLFQDRTTAPGPDDQADFYARVLRAFPGQRVVFRTMDVGADKPLPFVERDAEDNPALGLRGIRLHLARPELFRDQLRGLLRAAAAVRDEPDGAGRLAVMFPLVSTAAELVEARRILTDVAAGEGADLDGVEIGAMIEVPSAALGAARLAAHADFLSVGTNDLLQYLFAADRLHAGVADLADPLHPDVLALLRGVVEAGHAAGAWVGVCGEAAGDPVIATALVGLGVDELSMTRVAIPEVKDALAGVELTTARTAVDDAISETADAEGARRLLEERLAVGPAGRH